MDERLKAASPEWLVRQQELWERALVRVRPGLPTPEWQKAMRKAMTAIFLEDVAAKLPPHGAR
jgi:hypothetical protein